MAEDLSSRVEHLAHRHRWLVERLGQLAVDPTPEDDREGHRRMVAELVDEALAIDNDFLSMADRLRQV